MNNSIIKVYIWLMLIITGVNLVFDVVVSYIYTNGTLEDIWFFVSLPEIVLILFSLFLVIYILREKINKKYLVLPIVYFFGFVFSIFYMAFTMTRFANWELVTNIVMYVLFLFVIVYAIYLLKAKINDASHLVVPHKKINPWLIVLIVAVLLSIPMGFYLLSYFGSFDNIEQQEQVVVDNSEQEYKVEWRDFTSKQGNFRVQFPGEVLHDAWLFGSRDDSNIKMDGTIYYHLINNDDAVMFFVAFYKMSDGEEIPDVENLPARMIDLMDAEAPQTVVFSQPSNLKDYDTMLYSMRVEGTIMEEGEIFVVGDTVYNIGKTYYSGDYEQEMFDRFRDSFELLENPE